MPVLNLYACPDGRWFLEMSPHRTVPICAHLLFDPEQGDAQLHVLTRRLTTFAVNDALMLLFARRTAGDLTLEMHASVVEKDGRGVLLSWRVTTDTTSCTGSSPSTKRPCC